MASLTRNEWIEMFSTMKIMEANIKELRALLSYLPPYRRNQLKQQITAFSSQAEYIKNQIQSVIGQME